MSSVKTKLFIIFFIGSALMANEQSLLNDSLEDLLNTDIQTKAQVGSRDNSKDYLKSNNPIDVITLDQINSSGVTKLTDLLNFYIAGFTVKRYSLSDGTDHIVQYSLRGMQADQILVLVNGKRYHSSSLVSTSKGTSFVDLNSIPLIAVNRVEVLKDGAAAQYGSDAIAGVINIILKSNDENSISVHSGVRKKGDGQQTQLDSFINIPLDYDGFFNIALTANNQESTNRAGNDRRVTPPRVTMHYGIPESKTFGVVLNSELVSQNNTIFYSHLILNHHESEASTFYRTPDNTRPIYPNGFLPMLKDTILDYSVAVGAKGKMKNGTSWDISNIYGYNNSDFTLSNSMNYDLGISSPTSFHNGKLATIQNATNVNLKNSIDSFVVSGGLEYRYENYSIESGDSNSYYRTGSQGFPGYQQSNEVDASRNSYALYTDIIYNATTDFLINLALRYEDYSDFGDTTNYKLSIKYDLTDDLLFRATTSTGFRAPSMSQNNYSYTSSSLTGNTLTKKGIFQPNHPASKSLGASQLKAETSVDYSAGFVYQPTKDSYIMIDSFLVRTNDRILLSAKEAPTTPAQIAVFNQYNISYLQYFTNMADIETSGIDIKYKNRFNFSTNNKLDTSLWFNFTNTNVRNKDALSAFTVEDIEKTVPQYFVKLLNVYKMSHSMISLNLNYFNHFSQTKGKDTTKFSSMITTDLNIDYQYTKKVSFSLGGFNIFNTIPDKFNRSNKYFGYDGIMPYSQQTPVDYSGAYYYLALKYRF